MIELNITTKEVEIAASLNAAFCPEWFWATKSKKQKIAKCFGKEVFEGELAKNWNYKITKIEGNYWISWGRGFLIYVPQINGFVQRNISSKEKKQLCDQFESKMMKLFTQFVKNFWAFKN